MIHHETLHSMVMWSYIKLIVSWMMPRLDSMNCFDFGNFPDIGKSIRVKNNYVFYLLLYINYNVSTPCIFCHLQIFLYHWQHQTMTNCILFIMIFSPQFSNQMTLLRTSFPLIPFEDNFTGTVPCMHNCNIVFLLGATAIFPRIIFLAM